ncbi:MAG: ATP-binding protein [Saprospiraceae bacterium]|jgi:serine/threonine-protein kinase RsbW
MLKLPSNLNSICEVQPFVDYLARKYPISRDLYPNILISVTEAVTNAIRHGNQCDESKKVEIRTRRISNCIAIRVSDQGCGFDPNDIPDPTCPENLCKCGGRGVFIMQQLSDRIQFCNNGRTVELRFKL